MTYDQEQFEIGPGWKGDRSYVGARLDLDAVGPLKVSGEQLHFDAAEIVLDPPLPLVRVIYHWDGTAYEEGVRLDLGKEAFLDEPLAEPPPGHPKRERFPRDDIRRAIREISGLVTAARLTGEARRVADEPGPEERYYSGGERE